MKIDNATKQIVRETIADLEVQSMIFDMDIDIEALSLMPKSDYRQPYWLKKWKEKESGKDFDPYFDIDR